jgi:hypothetical protein
LLLDTKIKNAEQDPKEKWITTWPTAMAEKSVGTNAHAVLTRLTWDF